MALRAGALVATKYRLEVVLGTGGMGAVWSAQNEALGGARVAVKFLHNTMNKAALERFQREAHLASRIRSRHAVQVLDYGVEPDGDMPFIAMEYLEGEDLRHLLDRSGRRLAPALLVGILDQAARGLAKAHEAGLVHRDIKPENLFLCRDEDGEMLVKLLDFGIAKSIDATSGTATGTLIGTAYYMSPEQFLGSKDLDHRTDLWLLACVAYEALVGAPPFVADSVVAIGMKVASSQLPPAERVA
jgi:serine/threonine-protein kinase